MTSLISSSFSEGGRGRSTIIIKKKTACTSPQLILKTKDIISIYPMLESVFRAQPKFRTLFQLELGGKFRICRNYPDISYPKPVFKSFFAKTKFCLTPILKKQNC